MLNYTFLSFTVFQRVLQMDAEEVLHEFIYIDEAGFKLTKARRRGRNIIGHGAILSVPGQRGGNITLCAANTQNGVLLRHTSMGPYSTPHILTYLDIVTAVNHRHQMQYIVIWDNVSFHRSALVQNWFQHLTEFTELYLPPYSPFLNSIKEFFSAWQVEGLRSPAPGSGTAHSGHGGGLLPNRCRSCKRMDSTFKTVLLTLYMKFSGQFQLGEEIMSSIFCTVFSVSDPFFCSTYLL